MSLSISWLNAYPRLNALLSRHVSTARALGASGELEEKFIDAVEIPGRSAQHLRGLEGLYTRPFEVPESPLTSPVERHVTIPKSEEQAEFDLAGRADPSGDILLKQYAELAELLSGDEDLREAFVNGDYQQVSDKLARAAKEKLAWSPEISEEFLRQHPEEAMVIAADLGDIAEMLEDPEKAESLIGNVRSRLEDEIYDKLSGEVARMMKDSSWLDETFFRLHPRAALYLIEHPEERRRLDGSEEAQKEFIRHVAEYEAQVDPIVRAQELAGENPTLGEGFWRDNPGLALALCAERATGEHSLQNSALNYPDSPHDGGSPEELINRNQASRAAQILGNEKQADFEYLRKNPHLARFINENPDFAGSWNRDVRVSELIGTEDQKTRRVLRAYVSGLPWRDKSYWHWWV